MYKTPGECISLQVLRFAHPASRNIENARVRREEKDVFTRDSRDYLSHFQDWATAAASAAGGERS